MTLLDDLARYTPAPTVSRSRHVPRKRVGLAREIRALLRTKPMATFDIAAALGCSRDDAYASCYGMCRLGTVRKVGTAKGAITKNRPAIVWKLACE